MQQTALLFIPLDCFEIAFRVVEVPVKRNASGRLPAEHLACPLRLVQEADRIDIYRDGKKAYTVKDRIGVYER